MPPITTIIENILKSTPKAKHIIYKQGEYFIAKTLSVGVPSDSAVTNIPQSFDSFEVAQAIMRQPLIINGEPLLFGWASNDLILLDNPKNDACTSAALMIMQRFNAFILVGFGKTQARIDYEGVMRGIVNEYERLEAHQLQIQTMRNEKPTPVSFRFDEADSVTFQNAHLTYAQRVKSFAKNYYSLMVILSPASPLFEHNIQMCTRIPPEAFTAVMISKTTTVNMKQLLKRTAFAGQLNIVNDDSAVSKQVDDKEVMFTLFKNDGNEPQKIATGFSFAHLKQQLTVLKLSLNISYLYEGEFETSFLGVRLRFHKKPDTALRQVVVFMASSKAAEFQTQLDTLKEMQDIGYVILLIIQTSWEGNIVQLIRKAAIPERFAICFDQQNIFSVCEQVFGKSTNQCFQFEQENMVSQGSPVEILQKERKKQALINEKRRVLAELEDKTEAGAKKLVKLEPLEEDVDFKRALSRLLAVSDSVAKADIVAAAIGNDLVE